MRSLGAVYIILCNYIYIAAVSAFVIPHQPHLKQSYCFGIHQQHFISNHHRQDEYHHRVYTYTHLNSQSTELEIVESLSSDDSYITNRIPWKFQGQHDIYCQVSHPSSSTKIRSDASLLPAILLVHGFGVSSFYWRQTIASLTNEGYTVYAVDLLGQGMSAKPTENVTYSTNLWANQLDDFCKENIPNNKQIVLIGNSMGSISSLIAATGDFANEDKSRGGYIKEHLAGIGMFNCGIGMNVHSIVRDPKWSAWQRYLLDANFNFTESVIFSNVGLMKWVLDVFVTRGILRAILIQLYPVAENAKDIVDDALVDSIYLPAKDPNSPKVLSQILTNEAGLTPMEVHAKHGTFLDRVPIHVVWGDVDAVIPLDGIGEVGQFYTALAADEEDGNHVTMEVVHAGHVPFDEVPNIANESMLRWLNDTIVQKQQEKKSSSSDGVLRDIGDYIFGWMQPKKTNN